MRRLAPWVLAAAFAAWSFWPRPDSIPGWGKDPDFNLWSFEVVWNNLRGGNPPFKAPLFGGSPLGIAYSESQIVPALLFWPVRALAGNGAVALGVAAMALSLLAAACCAGWLRALGMRRLAAWGGLLFAGCGWLQSQYAHYQNLCVFVLPLALWSWVACERDPRPLRLCLCGLAFGWIPGWNLYFCVFADLCLIVLAARARKPLPLALSLAVQAPFLLPYLQLGSVLGGYGAALTYGAEARSVLGSAFRPRLIAPSFQLNLEAAGFLGAAWLVLMALSLRRRESRPWLLAAALAFWAALGRGSGLYDLLSLLPPVAALRAAGRAQILVALFSLPAVLGWLETLPPSRAAAALALAIADLLPAGPPLRTRVDPALWGRKTPLAEELSRSADPLLVVPDASERFMLDATQAMVPYFGGHSGRAPPGEELMASLLRRGQLAEALELTRARRVLALTPQAADEVRRLPGLAPRGCFRHLDQGEPCLFSAGLADPPPLRLDKDTRRRPAAGDWPGADFLAETAGVLEARQLDRCHLRRTTRILGVPLRSKLPLPVLDRARWGKGEVVLHLEARQALFRLGIATAEFEVICK
ncbi:MAG TPA: hypothetical protein VMK66_03210 [Myxococcales bacterium]|nr:hypothetical protein [Myxococcales bacterium]